MIQIKKKEKKQKVAKENTENIAEDWKKDGLFKAILHVGINGAQVDGDAGAAREQETTHIVEERVLVELEPEVEQQQDEAEHRHEFDIGRVEVEREPAGVRAR